MLQGRLLFMYPEYAQTDFIEAFNETQRLVLVYPTTGNADFLYVVDRLVMLLHPSSRKSNY